MKRIMKKKGALIVMICFLAAGKIFAQDTTALSGTVSLKQCIDIAIKNNLLINESDFTKQGSRINLQLANGYFLPNIYANINHNLSEGRVINSVNNSYVTKSSTYASYGLNLSENLWNAGSIRNNAAAYRLAYEASKMDLQQQKDNITINVILGYLQVLSYEEQLTAAKQQVESYKQQVEKFGNQDKEGALTNPATLTDLKGNMASSELSVINTQRSLETAKIALTQYLNVPYTGTFELQKIEADAPVLYDQGSDAIYQQALKNLAYIQAGRYRTLSAIKSFKSAKGQLYPTLSFNGSAGSNFSSLATDANNGKIPYPTQLGNNFGSSFGLGIYIPILNGLQGKSRVQQAQITVNKAKFEETSNRTALQQNVQQAYVNMNSGFEAYQALQDQVKNFGESSRIAEVRFNEGVTTSVEYIISKTNYDQATLNLIAQKYDYILRTKILDYYQGKFSLQP